MTKYISAAGILLHNCGNSSDYTTELPDDARNATVGCSGLLQAHTVVWTLVLDDRGNGETLTVGSCGAFPKRCQFGTKTGYMISRPSATSSLLTTNAVENVEFVQNGTLTCLIYDGLKEVVNTSCRIIIT
ncbi:hypothetical protein BaRGS_00011171, partial [Batillaria attramentaria]